MAKVKVSQYDTTAANNTDVANINIAEGCSPSNINNAIRAVMGHLKDFQAGNVTGNALVVAGGGTGAENAADARTNLGLGALAVLATVDTAQIDDDAITTAKILDANVTNAKMATDSVDTTQIVDDAVTSAKIDANAVDANALNVSGNGTSGQVLISDGDGSFSWDNTITKTTGSAPYYGARAWVVFNSSGTILNQGNVASVSKTGTGQYTITFSTAMPDADYAVCGTALNKITQGTTIIAGNTVPSAGSMTIDVRNTSSGNLVDVDVLSIVVFR